jgi:integrating conjugative element protein (TIGR03761 family)
VSETNDKKTVVFRTGELRISFGLEKFHTNKQSVFADRYDLTREEIETTSLREKSSCDDDELKRIEEYDARISHFEKRIFFKANIPSTKRRNLSFHDFNVVVRDKDSMEMPAIGYLESVSEDTILLHTKEAARAYIGIPRNGRDYAVDGLKQALQAVSYLWSLSSLDNPYVDLALLKCERSMDLIMDVIDKKTVKLERRITSLAEKGFKINVMQSSEPQEMSVTYKSPYGFKMMEIVMGYDKFVRILYTLTHRGIIGNREFKDLNESIKQRIYHMCQSFNKKSRLFSNPVIKGIQRSHWSSEEGNPAKFEELREVVAVLQMLPPNSVLCRETLAVKAKSIHEGLYTSDVKKKLADVNDALALRFGLDVSSDVEADVADVGEKGVDDDNK